MRGPAIAAALLAGSCTALPGAQPPAPEGLAEKFELVAFGDRVSGDGAELQRWEGPIRLSLGDKNAEPHAGQVDWIIDVLSPILPSGIQMADPQTESANFVILIGTSEELAAFRRENEAFGFDRAPGFDCVGRYFLAIDGPNHTIVASVILISSEQDSALVRQCIVQRIAEALGLPNDINDPAGTVFSSESTRQMLSRDDRDIVQILYDPRLSPGMSRDEAMPIVRRIAMEIADARQPVP